MLIRRWMTKNVVTVTPGTSMLKAGKLMKDRGIRRLPVVDDDNRVIGISRRPRPHRRQRWTCMSCTICFRK